MSKASPARIGAIRVLSLVLPAQGAGQSLRRALEESVPISLSAPERGLLLDLCFGVCRHRRLLDAWLDAHTQKPLKPSALSVRLVLLCGLHELWFSKRPAYAIVSAWPDVCRHLGADWAAGLVNALLRKAARENFPHWRNDQPPAIHSSLPDWLWLQFQSDWGERALTLAEASLASPPLTLRNNSQRQSREALITQFSDAGISCFPGDVSAHSVYLDNPVSTASIPGFHEGSCSIQDEAAQIPATLFTPVPSARVLDACAAPGGKTCQLAEIWPGAQIDALEMDPQRLTRITGNLQRLGLSARLLCGEAERPASWWEGNSYDAILLDAPCSATGILRRQPDSKWHKQPADIHALTLLQEAMLEALWPLLKRGGQLVYSTCSVIKNENQHQIAAFLTRHPDASDTTPVFPSNVSSGPGCQWLTTPDRWDGFYFCRLQKQ